MVVGDSLRLAHQMDRMGPRPCYVLLGVRVAVRCSTLEAGHRSDIGRCDFACSASLPALRRGMMVAFFHKSGISAWLSERLQISVRY